MLLFFNLNLIKCEILYFDFYYHYNVILWSLLGSSKVCLSVVYNFFLFSFLKKILCCAGSVFVFIKILNFYQVWVFALLYHVFIVYNIFIMTSYNQLVVYVLPFIVMLIYFPKCFFFFLINFENLFKCLFLLLEILRKYLYFCLLSCLFENLSEFLFSCIDAHL